LNVQVLGLPGEEMDIADAVMLFYMGNYSKRQWEAMADKVNRAMPGKKRHACGFVPNVSAIQGHLKRAGALLTAEDLMLVLLSANEDLVIDLTEEDVSCADQSGTALWIILVRRMLAVFLYMIVLHGAECTNVSPFQRQSHNVTYPSCSCT
jgi:hypothetical protein